MRDHPATTIFHQIGRPTLVMHRIYCYEVRHAEGGHTAHFHTGDNQYVQLFAGDETQAYRAIFEHIETLPPVGVLPHQWTG